MSIEQDITLIEKYFDNELTEVERVQLTERLQKDKHFRTLFDKERLLIRSIRFEGLRNDLQMLKNLEENMPDRLPVKATFTLKPWYYAAAAAILLLIVALWLLPRRETPEELFQAYYKPYPNVFEPTLRGHGGVNERSKAFQAYESGDYRQAAALFDVILKEKREPGMLMLAGNAHLVSGNTQGAKENFITLIREFDDLDLQAKWFLSLCYLKEGNLDEARKELEELGKTEISYAAKAKELLKKVH